MGELGLLRAFSCVEPLLCAISLVLLYRRAQTKNYRFLASYMATRLVAWCGLALLALASSRFLLTSLLAYKVYFWVFWSGSTVEAFLSLGILYEIYKLAMVPLPGLQRLGMLMFRWAAGIASIVTVGVALGPQLANTNHIVHAVFQLQQTENVLTLCMLLFVVFAIRPMGLSFRSRIFGVNLGIGILATSDLAAIAWVSPTRQLVSVVNILTSLAFLIAVSIWIAYFALPEPRRQMIVLPTTSPFLRWNQIALALGDAPGFVAVGGIDPAFLAPAEVEIMERASIKMTALALKS